MTATSKAVIKGYFESGDTPTGSQFSDLIDSYQDFSPFLSEIAASAATITTSGRFFVTDGAGGGYFVSADKFSITNNQLIINIPTNITTSAAVTFRNIFVSGSATFVTLNTTDMNVSGNTTLNNVTITGATHINNSITITGSETVGGDINVSGAFTAGHINDWHSMYVQTVSANSYDWVRSTPYAYTLKGIRRIALTGDCTIDVRKNGSSLATYSASAAVASAALSSSFVVGDDLTVVVTNVSACSGLSVYGQIMRAL